MTQRRDQPQRPSFSLLLSDLEQALKTQKITKIEEELARLESELGRYSSSEDLFHAAEREELEELVQERERLIRAYNQSQFDEVCSQDLRRALVLAAFGEFEHQLTQLLEGLAPGPLRVSDIHGRSTHEQFKKYFERVLEFPKFPRWGKELDAAYRLRNALAHAGGLVADSNLTKAIELGAGDPG